MVGKNHADTMVQKKRRLAASPEFFYRSIPESLDAQHELRGRLAAHLAADHPGHFEFNGSILHCASQQASVDLRDPSREPLEQISHFVEEDFMLLQPVGGKLLISAAANAYSSSGRLVKSVGKDVPWAHIPVPGVQEQLGARIDKILASIHPDFPSERFNWQLTPIGDVFFPLDPHAENSKALERVLRVLENRPERCGELLWIRAERQTLVRLPRTGAIAFGIHTFSDPLSSIQRERACLEAIRNLMVGFSADRLRYLEMDRIRQPVLDWIDSALAQAPP
jgi:dimethylamine monooxygenase subunit A